MGRVIIHQGKSLALSMRLIAASLGCLLIILALTHLKATLALPLSMLLSLILPASWFATRVLEIDMKTKTFFKGSWVMGFKFGQQKRFEEIKMISKKVPIKETEFVLPGNKAFVTNHEYQAFAIVDSDLEVYLLGHPLEKKISEKIAKINKKLGLPTH